MSAGMIRTAGLPIRLWLAGADPGLFARLRAFASDHQRYRAEAAAVASAIGALVVPDPRVGSSTRRTALACRRQLHRGRPVEASALARVALAAATGGHLDLADRLNRLGAEAADLGHRDAELAEAADAAADRILAEGWRALRDSPVGRQALADGTIAAVADIERRIASGEPWTTKRMRRRGEYLWRMVTRGATKTTPRGWLGHVAPLATGTDREPTAGPGLTPSARAVWTDNGHDLRVSADVDDVTRIALAPLHRVTGDRLDVWAVEPADPTSVRPVTVRLSPALGAVHDALRAGARPVADLERHLGGGAAVRDFLLHLARLGVLQVTRPGTVHLDGRRPGATTVDGFVDIYRGPVRWTASAADVLSTAARRLRALQRMMAADQEPPVWNTTGLTSSPRPLLDILAERLDEPARPPSTHRTHPVWPTPRVAGSEYTRLIDRVASARTSTVDLADLLDGPGDLPAWPIDCTARPLPGGGFVLDAVTPAGVLDARFAPALETSDGPLPQVVAYRKFLRHLDALTGIPSVELLVPPLSGRAANAVHRPRYTDAWTGDPDLAGYCPPGGGPARYVPLAALSVRLVDGRVVVAADGVPVRVLYHSTRVAPPPWDILTAILLRGQIPAAGTARLRHSLPALPAARYVPRLTLGPSVVLTPAQWRITAADLWSPHDARLGKLRWLVSLRERLELPRWVMASGGPGAKPVACDLESVAALSTLESVVTGGAEYTVLEEMVPAPDSFTVTDPAQRPEDLVAAELVVRLPAGTDPVVLARRAAATPRSDPLPSTPAA